MVTPRLINNNFLFGFSIISVICYEHYLFWFGIHGICNEYLINSMQWGRLLKRTAQYGESWSAANEQPMQRSTPYLKHTHFSHNIVNITQQEDKLYLVDFNDV